MMTPQEVAGHTFSKATLGGYNMAVVDEFLDLVTKDYTALYNDNAILKNKLKVLTETVEEYRATDDAMRKTLLAAQKMADSMVADAESKKAALLQDAENAARARIEELDVRVNAEEYRLQAAQEATASYVAEVSRLYEAQKDLLAGLSGLVPPKTSVHETRVEDAAAEIRGAVIQLTQLEEDLSHQEDAAEEEQAQPVSAEIASFSSRFEDLQFGKDYKIT